MAHQCHIQLCRHIEKLPVAHTSNSRDLARKFKVKAQECNLLRHGCKRARSNGEVPAPTHNSARVHIHSQPRSSTSKVDPMLPVVWAPTWKSLHIRYNTMINQLQEQRLILQTFFEKVRAHTRGPERELSPWTARWPESLRMASADNQGG